MSQTNTPQQPVLLTLMLQPQSNPQTTSKQVYTNVTWTNPTISNINVSQNLNITLNGNLNITETGELHLIHCILNINNGTTPVQYGVTVYGGIYINESSTITAINPANPYYFTVYEGAAFQMNNSRVEYCGDGSGSYPDQRGLVVRADDAWIENNTITECNMVPFWLFNSNGCKILNNNAINNSLYSFGLSNSSYNLLSGNTATNSMDGFVIEYGSNNNLTGNTAINWGIGIGLMNSSNNILTGNTAINGVVGFIFFDNCSYNNLSGNTAINCSTGYSWDSDCINNDFTGSVDANWLLVNVTDVQGYPIPSADVKVENQTAVYSTPYFGGSDAQTYSNGTTPWIAVPYRTFTTNDTMTENITAVTVYYQGFTFVKNPITVNMSTSHVETFQVIDDTVPTVEIIFPHTGGSLRAGVVVWINGTFDGTGSQVVNISINDSRFVLVEPSGPPYGVNGTFFFVALNIGISEFDVEVMVQDGAEFNVTATRHIVVVVEFEQPSMLSAVFSALMLSGGLGGGVSPLVSAVGGFAAGAGVAAVVLFYYFRRMRVG